MRGTLIYADFVGQTNDKLKGQGISVSNSVCVYDLRTNDWKCPQTWLVFYGTLNICTAQN